MSKKGEGGAALKLDRKKERILYIVSAAAFALVALAVLALLVRGSGGARETAATPEPSPTAAATAAPAPRGSLIGGKDTDPAAESFDLTGRALTGEDMAALSAMQSLTALSLNNCSVTDLRFLSGLYRLRTLYLPDNRIRDLAPLADLRELRTLYLDNNPIEDLTPLTTLPALSTLSIQGVLMADYALEDLRAAMPGCQIFCDSVVDEARPLALGNAVFTEDAETLDLSGMTLEDLSPLGYCLHLRELDLSGVRGVSAADLPRLPELRTLSLRNTELTDEDLAALAGIYWLSSLDLRDNPALTYEGVSALESALTHCEILHDPMVARIQVAGLDLTTDADTLDLSGRGLDTLAGLERFEQLRVLYAGNNALTDISPLAGLAALEELDLTGNRLGDIRPLESHIRLRILRLGHNGIQDISPLNGLVWLDALDLSGNAVWDLTPLTTCVRLRWLDLRGNPGVTADSVLALRAALPGCTIETDVTLPAEE